MTILHARKALLDDGWHEDVRVEIGPDGRIAGCGTGHDEVDADGREIRSLGILLPAPVNVHSHSFQRAMAGLSEHRSPGRDYDTFWTWREIMFGFLDRLTPDDVEAIAALVQVEMLEAGYATNVEFHYLHHTPSGTPYDDVAEMAGRIAAASETTGIGLTFLPVLYQHGGCDGRPLAPGQVRFGNDEDRFARLWEGSRTHLRHLPADARIGVAPHSLRAVDPDALRRLVTDHPSGPFHMHLAEQVPEVEEVRAAWGRRPVEWLLENAEPDARWCLIHCTQMLPHETVGLAATGAVAGLCPITESSLGDGTFDGVRWLATGGSVAIGSDSNIRIALSEELRTLEYSQRLRDRARAVLAIPHHSTGRRLFDSVCAGGAQAAGRATGQIEPGLWADLMALDDTALSLAGRDGDAMIDSWVFAGDDRLVTDVWSAGRHVVRGGRHIARAAVERSYRAAIARVMT